MPTRTSDRQTASSFSPAWGECWRFAPEISTRDLPRTERILREGLGLEAIARDEDFVMLSSPDLMMAVCLRSATEQSPPTRNLRVMLMLANWEDLVARLRGMDLFNASITTEGMLKRFDLELGDELTLTVYQAPT